MNDEKINKLIHTLKKRSGDVQVKRTHISWLILTDEFAYKIKKPLKLSFLDYSTLEKRRHCCGKEIELNRRLTRDLYLDVEAISENGDSVFFGNEKIIDYAVKMKRIDEKLQMDELIRNGSVSSDNIRNIAAAISSFHKNAFPIKKSVTVETLQNRFNDLLSILPKIKNQLGSDWADLIVQTTESSDRFLVNQLPYMEKRILQGYCRDCHGDLHSGNIFLTPHPVIFDCIEFNDDFRHIDVLDEIAFFCMDMDYRQRPEFGDAFFHEYLRLCGWKKNSGLESLFNYYKCYRANVRAKVIALNETLSAVQVGEIKAYLKLMANFPTVSGEDQ